MRYIPTYCDACGLSVLVSADALTDGYSHCSGCNSRTRSLPGESYGVDESAIFNELGTILREAGVSATSAGNLIEELELRRFGQPGRALRRLVVVQPALRPLLVIAANHASRLRKIEGMLAALLDAIAGSGRSSGLPPAVSAPAPKPGDSATG